MCEYIDVYGGIGSGFECRCGGLFCAVHRYSDKHECSFDYRELGAQEIRRNNPVVVSQKIHKIWACPPVCRPLGGGPPSPHRITYVLWFSLNKYSIEFVFLICILYVFLTAGRRRRAVASSVSVSFLFSVWRAVLCLATDTTIRTTRPIWKHRLDLLYLDLFVARVYF